VPGIFVDTKVFFYAYDDRDSGRQQQSRHWIAAISDLQVGVANLQVANEFTSVVLRRMPTLPPDTVFQIADKILSWGSGSLTVQTTTKARHPQNPALLLVGLPAACRGAGTRLQSFPVGGSTGWAQNRKLDDHRSFRP
jgi:4-diphosphocytidyl-2C-methyl-D-erythritol kinase